jgi:hypothetical protein
VSPRFKCLEAWAAGVLGPRSTTGGTGSVAATAEIGRWKDLV